MGFYYTDLDTAKFLNTDKQRVYLYGSYGGYNNFGDIIQLKNTIWFYRRSTDLEPVLLLHLAALEGPGHLNQIRRWYGCHNVIFIANQLVDASVAKLYPLETIKSGGLLHIYGGGFLNSYWGKAMIDKIEDMLDSLKPCGYLFSGQQVEDTTIEYLNKLFEKRQPLLFGLRDKQSQEYMTKLSKANNIAFSFDDVTEIFQTWRLADEASYKVRVINKLRPKSIMWHINTSSYSTKNKRDVLSKIKKVKQTYPGFRIVLAHIYNDIRRSLRDTLQSVIQLENEFPYYEYKVTNFAQMALDLHPEKNKFPNVANLFSTIEVVIASSYHISMFAQYFGIPAYLMSQNEYYNQKQKSLSLETNFDKFLNDPSININNYTREITERAVWNKLLAQAVDEAVKDVDTKKVKLHDQISVVSSPQITYRNPNT